ncbi:flagellar assembly protein FliW [Clostridium septicum]|uniref:Flagellar assembly factor FliW n=1 Tax=Clostridium septicum TaxID=1504 RepID=A0A9N7JIS5_CLOSE|nr:flagellar assembly protein FliW [Clostridium septicum]AYE33448.1 flagellar assembly protein FliW [Clostridium septicum]MDU1314767.1 flagellar assembly protein FliW [Clostridium septicum]QAS61619.1 flagellar assembly protein FliW [Clostridium septicum]UEC21942.1 flagellar assembly protein FliW [Clostridium septicum]USS00027.1 flagellar assembly protein FliW [Clostridium septicum]
MEIISPVHGKIVYSESDIINFEKGIPGFDNLKKYVIKEVEETNFSLLQSIEDSDLAFIITSPFSVEENYEIKLSEEIIKNLHVQSPNDVMLYVIVTLNSDVSKATVNLKAPLIINIKDRNGEQFIVDREEYKIRHPLSK